jgi:hypothetical protein
MQESTWTINILSRPGRSRIKGKRQDDIKERLGGGAHHLGGSRRRNDRAGFQCRPISHSNTKLYLLTPFGSAGTELGISYYRDILLLERKSTTYVSYSVL